MYLGMCGVLVGLRHLQEPRFYDKSRQAWCSVFDNGRKTLVKTGMLHRYLDLASSIEIQVQVE